MEETTEAITQETLSNCSSIITTLKNEANRQTDRQLQKSMKDAAVKHSQAALFLFFHVKYTLEDKLHLSAVCIFLQSGEVGSDSWGKVK